MTVLAPPPGYSVTVAIRGIEYCHPLYQAAWPGYRADMLTAGFPLFVNETYRYELRQQYLFGGGRTGDVLARLGIPASLARPNDPVVTNAWSAATSAHGLTITDGLGRLLPASAAIDIVPVGADGKPWDADDPWDEFLAVGEPIANRHGLRHFHDANGEVSDKPHVQLSCWSDLHHRLILPDTSSPSLPPAA